MDFFQALLDEVNAYSSIVVSVLVKADALHGGDIIAPANAEVVRDKWQLVNEHLTTLVKFACLSRSKNTTCSSRDTSSAEKSVNNHRYCSGNESDTGRDSGNLSNSALLNSKSRTYVPNLSIPYRAVIKSPVKSKRKKNLVLNFSNIQVESPSEDNRNVNFDVSGDNDPDKSQQSELTCKIPARKCLELNTSEQQVFTNWFSVSELVEGSNDNVCTSQHDFQVSVSDICDSDPDSILSDIARLRSTDTSGADFVVESSSAASSDCDLWLAEDALNESNQFLDTKDSSVEDGQLSGSGDCASIIPFWSTSSFGPRSVLHKSTIHSASVHCMSLQHGISNNFINYVDPGIKKWTSFVCLIGHNLEGFGSCPGKEKLVVGFTDHKNLCYQFDHYQQRLLSIMDVTKSARAGCGSHHGNQAGTCGLHCNTAISTTSLKKCLTSKVPDANRSFAPVVPVCTTKLSSTNKSCTSKHNETNFANNHYAVQHLKKAKPFVSPKQCLNRTSTPKALKPKVSIPRDTNNKSSQCTSAFQSKLGASMQNRSLHLPLNTPEKHVKGPLDQPPNLALQLDMTEKHMTEAPEFCLVAQKSWLRLVERNFCESPERASPDAEHMMTSGEEPSFKLSPNRELPPKDLEALLIKHLSPEGVEKLRSSGCSPNAFWEALKSNYNYIMDGKLIETCRVSWCFFLKIFLRVKLCFELILN